MTIGERLKEERSRLGFNQTDLATLGGVGKTTQINYEKGNGSPDAAYLAAVAEKGVDVLYVVTGERCLTSAEGVSPEEADLVMAFRSMSEAERSVLQRISGSLTGFQGTHKLSDKL